MSPRELFAFSWRKALAALVVFVSLPRLSSQATPGRTEPQRLFVENCAGCHGEEAHGTSKGPALTMNPRVAQQSIEQLSAYLEHGNVAAGMPAFPEFSINDRMGLARYLRRLNVETIVPPATESPRKINWGPPQPGDWLTYNGNFSANRYSPLKQINRDNVSSLKVKWLFPISYFGLDAHRWRQTASFM